MDENREDGLNKVRKGATGNTERKEDKMTRDL